MKKFRLFYALCACVLASSLSAFFPDDITARGNPFEYGVPIKGIAFQNSDLEWVDFEILSTEVIMDIASVNAGEAVGRVAVNGTLPAGTYRQMRFLINPAMQIKAVAYDSTRDRTAYTPSTASTGVFNDPNPPNYGYTLNNASSVAGNWITSDTESTGILVDPNDPTNTITIVATDISMPMGDGNDDEEVQEETGMETRVIDGVTYFYGDMPLFDNTANLSFTIDNDGDAIPDIHLCFNVANRAEFVWDAANSRYFVLVQGPDVVLQINGTTIVSRDDEQQQ